MKINALVLCQLVVYHEVSNEVSKFVKVSLLEHFQYKSVRGGLFCLGLFCIILEL